MKFYHSIAIMALIGYQANAVSLNKAEPGEPDEFFAAEQHWTEAQDSKKEVKAAKDSLELEQLKKDTIKSLENVKKFEEAKQKSDALIQHQKDLAKEQEEHDPKEWEQADYYKDYMRTHGFAPSKFNIVHELVQTSDDLDEAKSVLLDRKALADI